MIRDLSAGCANWYPVHDVYIFADSPRRNGVIICDHDFAGVIEAVPSGSDGWRGFLRDYHCGNEPWKEARWEIGDLGELIGQLEAGVPSAPEHVARGKIAELINFLGQARQDGEKVFLECQ